MGILSWFHITESTKGQLRKENDELKERISQMENELQSFARSQPNNTEERVIPATLDTNLLSLASPTQVTDQEPVPPSFNSNHKEILIPEGSTGYDYPTIFSMPFKFRTEQVRVVDPYIRLWYQIDNFERFCGDLVDHANMNKMGLGKITLTTCKADEANVEEQNRRFERLGKDWLQRLHGIELELIWADDKLLHHRHIDFCNGWKVLIDRGLNIYKPTTRKVPNDKFPCRQTKVDIIYHP
ncbi:hypothetical protein CAPTEDRAFT_223307 [Capitella teleta]|uniref:MITD1 C-terminal phospholipase D-like domain-containing protein n=1 Tax=Capitella teleta TaxID=283909 RepID=R7T815_CAPTE|nr:hypothetical protein CAPTEDRAFT_223307 [Capitella teleta]|eukprot:ELT89794.1 hypothetical protein CAPTEDRAFT_223307 [Capitella teleta]